jgi:hypothetical protein
MRLRGLRCPPDCYDTVTVLYLSYLRHLYTVQHVQIPKVPILLQCHFDTYNPIFTSQRTVANHLRISPQLIIASLRASLL